MIKNFGFALLFIKEAAVVAFLWLPAVVFFTVVMFSTKEPGQTNTAELARDVEVLISNINHHFDAADSYVTLNGAGQNLLQNRLGSPELEADAGSNYMGYKLTYRNLSEETCTVLGIKGTQKFAITTINGQPGMDLQAVRNLCENNADIVYYSRRLDGGDDIINMQAVARQIAIKKVSEGGSDDAVNLSIVKEQDLDGEALSADTGSSCGYQYQKGDKVNVPGQEMKVESISGVWLRLKNEYGETIVRHVNDVSC